MPGVVQPVVQVPSTMASGMQTESPAPVAESSPVPSSVGLSEPVEDVPSAVVSGFEAEPVPAAESTPAVQPVPEQPAPVAAAEAMTDVVPAPALPTDSVLAPGAEAPIPAPPANLPANLSEPAVPGAEAAVEAPALPAPLSTAEVLQILRSKDARPLTVAELASINDAIKRMEYASEIEKKMGEMNLGGSVSTSSVNSAAVLSDRPGGNDSAGSGLPAGLNVVRITGTRGEYSALLSSGGPQVMVKVGDSIGEGRIAAITLSSVQVATGNGVIALPFAAPQLMGTVSVSGIR
jgi:hypothetical protein